MINKGKFLYIILCISIFIISVCFIFKLTNEKKLNIYLVSLDFDKERRDIILSNINTDYIHGIDGKKLNIEKLKKDNKIRDNTKLKKGEIGCYFSHTDLLYKSLKSNKNILILEDDAEIKEDTLEKIKYAVKKAPKDFEILLIGYNFSESYDYKQIKIFHGAHAYVVNPNNIDKTKIDKLFPIGDEPYDIILPKKLKTYIVIPKIVELNQKFCGRSTTQIN